MFKNLLLGLGGTAAIGGIGYGIYSSTQSSNGGEGSSNAGGETDTGEQTGSQGTQTPASPLPEALAAEGEGQGTTQPKDTRK